MNTRIRIVRKTAGLTMKAFGERLGISDSAVSQIESGKIGPSDQTIRSICREFKIREEWLRTGEGEMLTKETRAAEMGRLVGEMMGDRPESFRTAFVTAMLRIPPESPVWDALEKAVNEIAQQYKRETPED